MRAGPERPPAVTIYACYSSEDQWEASIEDQMEMCRRHAADWGWAVVAEYADRAMSAGSAFRPDFQRMQADAPAGRSAASYTKIRDTTC